MDGKENLIRELCETIIEASLYWNSEDERKNPKLKTLRTYAKYWLNLNNKEK